MSIHTDRARAKAEALGAYAGNEAARDLWLLSKRELLEVALRLGVQVAQCGDTPQDAAHAVNAELLILRENGVV